MRTSEVNAGAAPDLNEAFFVKRERSPDDPLRRSGRRFVGPNVWPDNLPGFRENVLAYTGAMDAFARRLLPAVAAALDLPPDWFDAAFEESQFSFRLSHYPPVAAGENQFGIAPHTDVNFMTWLPQSEIPGLEVLMPFRGVGRGPRAAELVRGSIPATPCTAGPMGASGPPPTAPAPPAGGHRYAIPFFLGPHVDTLIECLPTCREAGSEPRFPPITYGDYLDGVVHGELPPVASARRLIPRPPLPRPAVPDPVSGTGRASARQYRSRRPRSRGFLRRRRGIRSLPSPSPDLAGVFGGNVPLTCAHSAGSAKLSPLRKRQTPMASVDISQVRKSFGSTEVIHGVDVEIPDGEFVVLVGPSGCGKSTLLRLVAGLEEINVGEISIDGRGW